MKNITKALFAVIILISVFDVFANAIAIAFPSLGGVVTAASESVTETLQIVITAVALMLEQ